MDFRDRVYLDLGLTLRELEELHDALTNAHEAASFGSDDERITKRVLELIEASVNEAAETNTWKHVGGAQ
tara:strand:- start:169 stop:378 length:210 start_codon:yes stop_codon:yes gene_type:complete